eukprot:TRINITY_DN828_c0_g1_i2.p2 TRINITY_DN828_c0_g1~~TRINITY_DN828_c0_g1_i2.p2  ORF type:complete len:210 (+),score=31.57 TRINITY_DN828_c0_g1_i2:129-758(+)
MAKTVLGCICGCMGFICRFLNLLVLGAAGAACALTFVIQRNPSFPAGWGFVCLSAATALSGFFGFFTAGSLTGCFGCHLLFIMVSTAGLCATSIIIFVRKSEVLAAFQPNVSPSDADLFLTIIAGLFLGCFALNILILILSCLVGTCGYSADYYESVDKPKTAKEIAREQRADAKLRAKIESSSAHQLAEKMKKKYGFNSDYDVEAGKK